MQREKYIDVAKGIGIILVVYAHIILICGLDSLKFITDYIYAFHMPLFFMMAGYGQGMKKSNARERTFFSEVKKIMYKLMLPYLVWSIVYMYIGEQLTSTERIKATLTLRGIAPMWFLAALALCELALVILNRVTGRLSKKTVKSLVYIAVCVLCLTLAFAMDLLRAQYGLSTETGVATYYLFVTVSRFFLSFPFLAFGFMLAKSGAIKKVSRIWSAVIGVVMLAVTGILVTLSDLSVNVHMFEISSLPVFICTALLGSVGVLMVSYSFAEFSRVVYYLGRNTLGIMVLHYVPFLALSYGAQFAGFIWSNEIFISIMGTVFTMLICIGGIWLYKKKFFIIK